MTRPLLVLPAAQAEITGALDWYEREAPGLGACFRAELEFQAARITAGPLRFPLMLADVRRAKLRRFPYGLFFRPLDDAIYVIACFHSSRDPHIWQSRV
jgi:toxin ParE1/3/4